MFAPYNIVKKCYKRRLDVWHKHSCLWNNRVMWNQNVDSIKRLHGTVERTGALWSILYTQGLWRWPCSTRLCLGCARHNSYAQEIPSWMSIWELCVGWASAATCYVQLCERDNNVDGCSCGSQWPLCDHRHRVTAEVAVNRCSTQSALSHDCHSGNISGCMELYWVHCTKWRFL